MGRPYQCPGCGSIKTIWKGYRRLEVGRVRLRMCKACGRKFTSRVHVNDCGGESQ